MRTPWMKTSYKRLHEKDIVVKKEDGIVTFIESKENASYVLTDEQYRAYILGKLDFLVMENLYYRGLALNDSGERIENFFEGKEKYYPLPSSSCNVFDLSTEQTNYKIMLNPEIGSWVAFEDDEYEKYLSGVLYPPLMENLYLRGLASDSDKEMVEMDFPEPADKPSVIVVNLTMTCNLKCKYCFASCGPGQGENLSEAVMKRIIEQMFCMPSRLITFELQGGEPLCYMEGMKTFVKIAEQLKDKYNKIVQYRTVTNATLISDDFIDFAKHYNIAVCVSLDGDKDMTNQTRVYADGTGAFDEIMKGVKKLQDNYQIDGAVCTIGQHNMKYAKRIMDFFVANGISFKPRPANILGREKINHTTTNSGEWADAFIEMHKLSESTSIENYSVHIYEENVYGPVRDYICLRYPCGAAREVISVNPDGSIYPCDGFKSESKFCMGNILNESLDEILQKEWVKTLRDRTYKDIEKCSKCMFRAMCCSCCYSAYGAYGTIYREDPQCMDRKKIFTFLIRNWLEKDELCR